MDDDRLAFFITLVCGVAISAFYMFFRWGVKRKHPEFVNVAIIFISVAGCTSGSKLGYLVIKNDGKFLVSYEDKLAIFIGGIAVIWLSCIAIVDCFKEKK